MMGNPAGRPVIDLTGQSFGRWTVLGRSINTLSKRVKWNCRCTCGTTKEVRGNHLRGGVTKSCGCLCREIMSEIHTVHGLLTGGVPPEYRSWANMISRCTNPENIGWENYGGRGITVCERWQNSFPNFLMDMGKKPSHQHSIDRIDNDGPYSPANCRWATRIEQASNTRRNRLVTVGSRRLTIAQFAREFGVNEETARYRHIAWTRQGGCSHGE